MKLLPQKALIFDMPHQVYGKIRIIGGARKTPSYDGVPASSYTKTARKHI